MIDPVTIQAALKEAGFYKGELDGDFGPASRAARDAALAEAGVATAGWPHSRLMVAIRQWVLKRAGFDPGPLDGLEGAKTRAADLFERVKLLLAGRELLSLAASA